MNKATLIFGMLMVSAFCSLGWAQSLELASTGDPGGTAAIAVNYNPEGARVVALQFDLQFDTKRLNAAALQVSRGKALAADNGFDFRQIQPGTLRVIVYPPVRQQMPALAGGQLVSIQFPGLDKLALGEADLRFVPGSIVLSDAAAKKIDVRATVNLLGKEKSRRR